MSEPKEYEIKGHKLVCPICSKSQFWTRTTLMNTRGASFLGFDWANSEGENYICNNCGYIMWFWPQD